MKMGTNLASSYDYADDDDYIDMELNSSPKTREFEFQMSTTHNHQENTTFTADELFYNGKLLPLHLLHRRQILENLLAPSSAATTTTTAAAAATPFEITKMTFQEDHYYSMPPTSNSPPNISPEQSRRLNPDDYFNSIKNQSKFKPWAKKLKLIKNSILAQKLKASRAYLKSLFCNPNKNCNRGPGNPSNDDKKGIEGNRRSFSGEIKRHSPTKCLSSSSSSDSSSGDSSSSSSSFSVKSNCDFLRRSCSAGEIEVSVDAAIAHCKNSLQIFDSICPVSASRIEHGGLRRTETL